MDKINNQHINRLRLAIDEANSIISNLTEDEVRQLAFDSLVEAIMTEANGNG